LEGLEVSEILLSDLKDENKSFRMDSEYFRKECLKNIKDLKTFHGGCFKLQEVIKHITGGATPLGAAYQEKGVPFLRVQNIMQNYFNLSDIVYISQKQDNEIKRSRLKENDVLLTITGVSYGKSAVVPSNLINANINQHSVKISLTSELNPYFLSTFLNAKQGKLQSDKNIVGVTRPALDYEVIRNFIIPRVSIEFQKSIENIIKQSVELTERSHSLYHQAEELLLETIGLKDFQPTQENKNIKSFSESFLATGRLDAEYYLPRYEEILLKVKQQEYDLLGNLVSIKKSIEPGSDAYSDEGLPFLRVADYNKFGISNSEKKLSNNFCNDNRKLIDRLKPKKETILFSKDGSVGTAYMLREDADFITSGAILHLTVKNKKVLPEYLTLALNSEVVQQQAERDAGGSIILHCRMKEIEKVAVPVVNDKIQGQIAELIKKSFCLRIKSERLLNEAKNMVEKEIDIYY
jgi:restriction endonuclease S subunit